MDLPIYGKKQLNLQQKSINFVSEGNLKTDYRMKDQIRAAASSISNNIAEGFEYGNKKIFIRFLTYSKGSAGEVFNQFTILFKAEMISDEDYKNYSNKALELGRKIGGFIQYLKKSMTNS